MGDYVIIWRLVNNNVATYKEIMTFWDINDVMHANEWLDLQSDREWLAQQNSKDS